MKNRSKLFWKSISFIGALFFTIVLFFFKPDGLIYKNSNTILDEYMLLKTDIEFINIFFTNLIVAFLITYGGFFTSGILTLFIWGWNTLIVYIIYSHFINIGTDLNLILYFSKHFFLELYAFISFSLLSFRGIKYYREVFFERKIRWNLMPKCKELIIPVVVLFLSSIIEVL